MYVQSKPCGTTPQEDGIPILVRPVRGVAPRESQITRSELGREMCTEIIAREDVEPFKRRGHGETGGTPSGYRTKSVSTYDRAHVAAS